MDTAKAAALSFSHNVNLRDRKAPFANHDRCLPLIAVPTTAGTGSEVTQVTVVIDSESGEKMLLAGSSFLPEVAVIDHELTMSMPLRLTADTGIDALCHAMEAYVSRKANAFTDGLALTALRRIGSSLRAVCETPSDAALRAEMMVAATEAGIAFSNSSVTLVHGMSRPLGARFHIPHGMSNAQLVSEVTSFSLAGAVDRFATVARELGMCPAGVSNEDAAECLPTGLRNLCADLGVPSLQDCGVDRNSLEAQVADMAKDALASGSPNNNPIIPSASEIESLYMRILNQGARDQAA